MPIDPDKIKDSKTSELLSQFERIRRTPTVTEKRMRDRIAEIQSQIEAVKQNPGYSADEIRDYTAPLQNKLRTYGTRLENEIETKHIGDARRWMSKVGAEINEAATSSSIRRTASSPEMLAKASLSARGMSPFALRRSMQQNTEALRINENYVSEYAMKMDDDPASKEIFAGFMGGHENLIRRGGELSAIDEYQRKHGLDFKGSQSRVERTRDKILSERDEASMLDRVRNKDGIGSFKDESSKLKAMQDEFLSTLNEFTKALAQGTEEAEEFAEKLHPILANQHADVEKQTGIVDTMKKEGMTGGGFFDGVKNFFGAGAAGDVGRIALNGADIYRHATITTPIEVKQQQAALINSSVNRQFDDYNAAFRGNAGAYRRLTGGFYGKQQNIRAEAFGDEETALKMELGGGVALTADAGIGAFVKAPLRGAGSVTGGASDIVNAATPLAKSAISALNKVQQMKAANASDAAEFGIDTAKNYVSDTTGSMYLDQIKSATIATRGAGSRRGAAMDLISDPAKLAKLADATGMNIGDLTALTHSGIQSMGSQFRTSDVTRAGTAQRAGYMTGSEYFQHAGALSQYGGSSDDLEKIMERAISAGMDSSKNISQLVSATLSASHSSAMMGLSTVGGASDLVNQGLAGAIKGGIPENMRSDAVSTAIGRMNEVATSRDFNLNNVMEYHRLAKNFKGSNALELSTLHGLNATQIKTLSRGDDEAKKLINDLGLDKALLTADGKVNGKAIQTLKQIQQHSQLGAMFGQGAMGGSENFQKITKAIDSGTLPELMRNDTEIARNMKQGGFQMGVNGEITSSLLDFDGNGRPGTPRGQKGSGAADAGNQMIGAEGVGVANQLAHGAQKMDLNSVVAELKNMAANFQPEKFAEAAKKVTEGWNPGDLNEAGKNMALGAEKFESAADDLKTFMTKTLAKMGMNEKGEVVSGPLSSKGSKELINRFTSGGMSTGELSKKDRK